MIKMTFIDILFYFYDFILNFIIYFFYTYLYYLIQLINCLLKESNIISNLFFKFIFVFLYFIEETGLFRFFFVLYYKLNLELIGYYFFFKQVFIILSFNLLIVKLHILQFFFCINDFINKEVYYLSLPLPSHYIKLLFLHLVTKLLQLYIYIITFDYKKVLQEYIIVLNLINEDFFFSMMQNISNLFFEIFENIKLKLNFFGVSLAIYISLVLCAILDFIRFITNLYYYKIGDLSQIRKWDIQLDLIIFNAVSFEYNFLVTVIDMYFSILFYFFKDFFELLYSDIEQYLFIYFKDILDFYVLENFKIIINNYNAINIKFEYLDKYIVNNKIFLINFYNIFEKKICDNIALTLGFAFIDLNIKVCLNGLITFYLFFTKVLIGILMLIDFFYISILIDFFLFLKFFKSMFLINFYFCNELYFYIYKINYIIIIKEVLNLFFSKAFYINITELAFINILYYYLIINDFLNKFFYFLIINFDFLNKFCIIFFSIKNIFFSLDSQMISIVKLNIELFKIPLFLQLIKEFFFDLIFNLVSFYNFLFKNINEVLNNNLKFILINIYNNEYKFDVILNRTDFFFDMLFNYMIIKIDLLSIYILKFYKVSVNLDLKNSSLLLEKLIEFGFLKKLNSLISYIIINNIEFIELYLEALNHTIYNINIFMNYTLYFIFIESRDDFVTYIFIFIIKFLEFLEVYEQLTNTELFYEDFYYHMDVLLEYGINLYFDWAGDDPNLNNEFWWITFIFSFFYRLLFAFVIEIENLYEFLIVIWWELVEIFFNFIFIILGEDVFSKKSNLFMYFISIKKDIYYLKINLLTSIKLLNYIPYEDLSLEKILEFLIVLLYNEIYLECKSYINYYNFNLIFGTFEAHSFYIKNILLSETLYVQIDSILFSCGKWLYTVLYSFFYFLINIFFRNIFIFFLKLFYFIAQYHFIKKPNYIFFSEFFKTDFYIFWFFINTVAEFFYYSFFVLLLNYLYKKIKNLIIWLYTSLKKLLIK